MLDYLTSPQEPRWTRWLLLLFVPLLILYEVSIVLARIMEKKRAARDAEIDAETAGTGPDAE